MDANIKDLLNGCAAFASLDEDTRTLLLPKFTRVDLKSSDILFHQGDASDSVYFLTSGKLLARLMTGAGEGRDIGYIDPGETVGEIGAFTNEPRTLTVRAVKESVLLKLSIFDFLNICQQHPTVMSAILRPLLSRTTNLIQMLATGKRSKHIAIIPANRHADLQEFNEEFCKYAAAYGNLLVVSDYHPEFHEHDITVDKIKEKIQRLLDKSRSIKTIVYLLKATDTPLGKYALKRADVLYIAAHHDSAPRIDKHILEKADHRKLQFTFGLKLLLVYKDETVTPTSTKEWLKLADFSMHHHLRRYKKSDWMRLLRFIRGKAVGVALSGGGTRGWAHLGALRALREHKIPIDMIGGTSVGALAAGCYAMNQTFDDAHARFTNMVIQSAHSVSWRSLTWPIISLFNAKNYTHALQKTFGEQAIEDLWLPYFCVTTNLANNTEDIHQNGLLWKKIRASSSIPGVLPPMLLEGELHYDGGLLNNLPADLMRKFIGHHGRVISIELNSFAPDKQHYQFPPIVTFWDGLLYKLGLRKHEYKFPKFIDTFMHSLFVGAELRSRQNALASNVRISFKLDQFNMLHSSVEEGKELVRIGYEETLRQLKTTSS